MAEHGTTSDTSHGHSADDHAHDSHGGLKKYLVVSICLCVLTGASFFTYSDLWPFHDTPAVGWAFMMAVSCTKALLVICFFMHLLWEANWKYVLTIPASVMSIFLCLALVGDIGMRTRFYAEERWLNASEPLKRPKHGAGHDDTTHATDAHSTKSPSSSKH